jgi:peptide/nickel transport system permease protein
MSISYLIRRIIQLIIVLLGMTVVVFSLIHFIPGDPVRAMLGDNYTPEAAAKLIAKLDLDKPLPVQYITWLGKVLQGDLGKSLHTKLPVLDSILERYQITFSLAMGTMVISVFISIPLGVISATNKDSIIDNISRIFSMIGAAVPSFWLALLFMIFFSVVLKILPPGGSPREYGIKALIMPWLVNGIRGAALLTRMTRSTMLDTLGEDYVRTAKAKGLSKYKVEYVHAFRNALIPVTTAAGLQFGVFLGGSVLVESIFSLPGVGTLIINSIYSRDYPVIQGGLLFIGVFMILVTLLVDILYSVIDPRIKYSDEA